MCYPFVHLLGELESLTNDLQDPSVTLGDTRVVFDGDLRNHQSKESLPDRLGSNARVIDNPTFLAAKVKVQDHSESDVTTIERKRLKRLLKLKSTDPFKDYLIGLPFTDFLWKAQRRSQQNFATKYVTLRFILGKSNIGERLFLLSRFALGNSWNGIVPSKVLKQMSIHVKYNLWSIEDPYAILQ